MFHAHRHSSPAPRTGGILLSPNWTTLESLTAHSDVCALPTPIRAEFSIDPTTGPYTDAQVRSLYSELQTRLGALPGVISASYSSYPLLGGTLWTNSVK